MTSKVQLYLDGYERQARLAPGLLALLPVSIAIASLGLKALTPVSLALGSLTVVGGPALLADSVRDRGRKVEDRLNKQWGGRPSTQLLRTRNEAASSVQRDKWRSAVEKATGATLATARSEARSPLKADELIESAVDDLRDEVRPDPQFHLLRRENKAYGFRRNCYGYRLRGLFIAVTCVAILLVCFLFARALHQTRGVLVAAMVIDLGLGIFWIFRRPDWVRRAGDRYAYQLMQAAVVKAKLSSGADS